MIPVTEPHGGIASHRREGMCIPGTNPDQTQMSTYLDQTSERVTPLAPLIDAIPSGKIEWAEELIAGATTDLLLDQLAHAVAGRKRVQAFLISKELTRRGLPPAFRRLPEPDPDDPGQRFDLFLYDAEWLAVRYPEHKARFSRWQGIFRGRQFHQTVAYAFWDGRREAWQFGSCLGLTSEQRQECCYAGGGKIGPIRAHIRKTRSDALSRISEAVWNGKSGGQTEEERVTTIRRRQALWECACLSEWKPQRTAHLYGMLTGEEIPRNVVAKQLAKIQVAVMGLHQ